MALGFEKDFIERVEAIKGYGKELLRGVVFESPAQKLPII